MPCGERPEASTTCAPSSTARWIATLTRGVTSSCTIPAPSTQERIVPSTSRATSRGRHPAGTLTRGPRGIVGWRSAAGEAREFVGCSLVDRLQDLAAEPLLQRLGHAHRPVGLLVGLEDRDDRAGHRAERAVEGRDRLDAAVEPAAGVEPPGLELRAVRGRGQLAVLALGRDPGLAVE